VELRQANPPGQAPELAGRHVPEPSQVLAAVEMDPLHVAVEHAVPAP
jgi:hypothetical protein